MATFDCTSCGKFYASFGQFIGIERQLSESDYYCRYGITGDIFPGHVLPEYVREFADEFEADPISKKLHRRTVACSCA